MCLIWMIGLKLIQSLGMKKDQQIDDSLDSASDYTVKIDNLPYGEYDQHQLIQYLEEIWMDYFASSELQMKSIQIVYNMEECEQKIQEIFKISQVLISYLEKNQLKFSNKIKNENIEAYKQGKKRMISLFKELQNARVEFKRNKELRKKKSTTIAFVEFTTPKKKTQFLECVQEAKNPLKDTFMPPKKFLFKGLQPSIARAPEPSDIMWSNCEKCVSYFRVVIIWFFTMIILYISYALISFLQTLDFIKETEGIVTSVILQLVNRLIWLQLSWLVVHELNNTKTEAIISLMKKSMIAQAINIICTPVISKFVNNKGLYGYEGLSTMAITYQLVMVLMMIFYYILNPIYLAKMFCFKVPCLRNILIKKNVIRRYSTAGKTTMEEIKGVLKLYEGPDFPVAGGFVYMTTAIFHSLFFCHLQPFLLMFVAINMSLFFFIMRYMLYRRCTIPEMTNVQVFRFAMFAISCGAAFYGIGCLFFLIIDEDVKIKQNLSLLIPPILCLIIWFVGNLDICGLFTYLNNFLLSALASSTQSKSNKISKRTFRETINLERLEDHLSLSLNHAHIWSRRECYYRDCNTNKLLQFQNYLRKTKDQFRLKRGQPLKKFCQSFFRRHERQDLHKNDDRQGTEMDLNNFCYFYQHIPVIKDCS